MAALRTVALPAAALRTLSRPARWSAGLTVAAGLVVVLAWAAPALGQSAVKAETAAPSKMPAATGQDRSSAKPAHVNIGVHVLRLTDLDITNNRFALDFWVWFRWTDDRLKPHETFELTNGKIDAQQIERLDKIDGVNYACLRVQATMTCFWDVSRFPLGNQKLAVEFEDNDLSADQLVYLPDNTNCGVDQDFRAAGWRIVGFYPDLVTHSYMTNYGDPRRPACQETPFSRAIFTIQLQRVDMFHAFKYFAGLYLAALVAFTVFFVKPDYRLPLTVGAVFTVVTNLAVVSDYLPEVGMLTLADKLHLVTGGVILVSLFETAFALHLLHKDREADYKRLDRVTFWITAPLFLAANAWLLVG